MADITISDLGSWAAAVIAAISIWIHLRDKRFDEIKDDIKDLRSEMSSEFDKVYDQFSDVNKQFSDVRKEFVAVRQDISEVKERLAFIEATTLRFEIPENSSPRSAAAKRIWDKRKAKQLEEKD